MARRVRSRRDSRPVFRQRLMRIIGSSFSCSSTTPATIARTIADQHQDTACHPLPYRDGKLRTQPPLPEHLFRQHPSLIKRLDCSKTGNTALVRRACGRLGVGRLFKENSRAIYIIMKDRNLIFYYIFLLIISQSMHSQNLMTSFLYNSDCVLNYTFFSLLSDFIITIII